MERMRPEFEREADAVKAAINSGKVPLGAGPGFGFHTEMHGGKFLDAAATYLGLTEDQLRTQLESGKSLADVAKAQGKSVDGLKQAIVDAATKELDQVVTDKRITADQEQTILADLKARLDDLVNGTLKRPGPFSAGPPVFRAPGSYA